MNFWPLCQLLGAFCPSVPAVFLFTHLASDLTVTELLAMILRGELAASKAG